MTSAYSARGGTRAAVNPLALQGAVTGTPVTELSAVLS